MSPRRHCIVSAVVGLVLTAALALPARAADSYKVDPVHSAVHFRVKHMDLGYIYGRFNKFSGSFTLDPTNPAKSSLEIKVEAASVDTNNDKRDEHLRKPDFFNVKEHPLISFKAKKFKKQGKNTFEVTGNLTLRGTTRPVTVKLEQVGSGKDPGGMFRTGLEAVFTIKRSEFGMKAGLDKRMIGDRIRIMVAVEGIRQ
jgi:polyisoprenoid-binding protein YceI